MLITMLSTERSRLTVRSVEYRYSFKAVGCPIVVTHTLTTASGIELGARETMRCAHGSDSKDEKHSYFSFPADLNTPEDNSWKHHDYHISENVDYSVRVVYHVLFIDFQSLMPTIETRFT